MFNSFDERAFLRQFEYGELIDYPLQAQVLLDAPGANFRFFPENTMPAGHAFLVESYALQVVDTQKSYREIAVALSFSTWRLLLAGREYEAKFSGADFLDFLNSKFIVRPVTVKTPIAEHVNFMVQADFRDPVTFGPLQGTRLQLTLGGKHLRLK